MFRFEKLFYVFQKSHPSIAYINVSVLHSWIMSHNKKDAIEVWFHISFYKIDAFRWLPKLPTASLWNFAKWFETIVKFNNLMLSFRRLIPFSLDNITLNNLLNIFTTLNFENRRFLGKQIAIF